MISKSAQYAVRAVIVISAEPSLNHGAQEIAGKIGAPPNYMGKLLRLLADAGVLESTRGSGGGFRLARPSGEISLFEIVEPIDKVSRWTTCFLGLSSCSPGTPCALHPRWEPIRESYLQMLKELTIAEIPSEMEERLGDRLAAEAT
jgi:Rrf2 family protein